MRASGLLLAVGAWALLLRGLFLLPPAEDPSVDLDAGTSFEINIDVYLPAIALTVLLLVVLPFVAVMRLGSLLGIGACLISAGYAMWVDAHHQLLEYIPALSSALRLAGGLSAAGLLLFVVETTLRRPASTVPH